MADLRKRANIITGASDVKSSGATLIGDVVTDTSLIPTSAVSTPDTGLNLVAAGFISEDGVSKTVDRSTSKIKDWNGDTVIVLQEDHSVTLKLTFLEALNASVLKTVYGENNVVIKGDSMVLKDNAEELPHRSFMFEIKGSATSKIRLFVPDGQVTKVGDVKFVKKDVIKYDVEIECFPDGDSNKLYQFIDRTGAVSGGSTTADKLVTLPSGTSGGTWTLTVNGKTTSALAFDATSSAVQSAITTAGAAGVTVTGNDGGPYTIKGATSVTASGASLTGGSTTTISVA